MYNIVFKIVILMETIIKYIFIEVHTYLNRYSKYFSTSMNRKRALYSPKIFLFFLNYKSQNSAIYILTLWVDSPKRPTPLLYVFLFLVRRSHSFTADQERYLLVPLDPYTMSNIIHLCTCKSHIHGFQVQTHI